MKYKDKIKHFFIFFLLLLAIYWLSQNLALAILAALIFGLTKELYDQAKGKNTVKESIADFSVNILGIILGILIIKILIPNLLTS